MRTVVRITQYFLSLSQCLWIKQISCEVSNRLKQKLMFL